MKKIFSLFVVLLIVFVTNLEAQTITKKSFSEEAYQIDKIMKTFQDIEEYNADDVKKTSISDIEVKFVKYNKNSDGSFKKYTEYFKKTDNGWFNYKEVIAMGNYAGAGSNYAEDLELTQSMEYYENSKNCSASGINDFVNDNCQAKTIKKIVATELFSGREDIQIIFKYDNKPNYQIDRYSYYSYSERWNDSFDLLETVNVKRDANNKVKRSIYTEYSKNKKYATFEEYNPSKYGDIYNNESLDFKDSKTTYFNKSEKVRWIGYNYANGTSKTTSYTRNKSNKITAKKIVKRNYNDLRTSTKKIKYRSNGKKSGLILYKYKKGKTNKRIEYVYNKQGNVKGNARKYVTSYKKVKKKGIVKNKTTKYSYNKKGKAIKKQIMKKHRHDFYVKDYDWYYYDSDY